MDEKAKFLIDNFFVTYNDLNLFCMINDLDGKIIFLNDYWRHHAFTNPENALGRTLREIMVVRTDVPAKYVDKYLTELEEIYEDVIQTRKKRTFFTYAWDLNGNNYIRLANVFHFVSADKELLGTYTLSWHANPFNFFSEFQKRISQRPKEEVKKSKLALTAKLTTREQEVIFLICHDFSQYEIADFLHISRGTVQKIINNQICEKFAINDNNVAELIAKAKLLKLDQHFPPTLLRGQYIDLGTDASQHQEIADLVQNVKE